jgi:hypothetical protein
MRKRGQLTIFILISVVIVIMITFLFLFINSDRTSQVDSEYWGSDEMKEKLNNLNYNLENCINSVTLESLILVAFQGGYYNNPQKRFDFSPLSFPYYYYEGQIDFPSIDRIESELGDCVNDKIVECVKNIDISNLDIGYESPITEVKITKNNVYFNIDMDIIAEKEKNKMTIELKEKSINHNSSLYDIHELAEYITMTHEEDSEYYCMNCLGEMAKEKELFLYFFPSNLDEKITGIMIYENRTKISDPYVFIFFNKYTGREETPKLKL